MKYVLSILCGIVLICNGCSKALPTSDTTTITFWHFWSEPDQRRQLDSIIDAFEDENPDIDIIPTELAWSDGKAKLQLAFNAGTAPDILHIGLDWYPQFASLGALAVLPDSLMPSGVLPALAQGVRYNDTLYALPWLVNARAHLTWDTTPVHWGLCSSDPHNVLKRTLPILWARGASKFCTSYPISATIDENCIDALDSLRIMARSSILDHSRQLDVAFARKQISDVVSGIWMLDNKLIEGCHIVPAASILNADVVAVARHRGITPAIATFMRFLMKPDQQRKLQMAGFPTRTVDLASDTSGMRKGFAQTVALSLPIPTHPRFLDIEPLLEDAITRCLRASNKQECREIILAAKSKIRQIEL